MDKFVSRAGEKLQYAIDQFKIDVNGLTVADFGSSTADLSIVYFKMGLVRFIQSIRPMVNWLGHFAIIQKLLLWKEQMRCMLS